MNWKNTASPPQSQREARPSVHTSQVDYQECLGRSSPQWVLADWAMRQQLQHPSSHHGFATDLQQDTTQVTSLLYLSFSYHLLSCLNRLNSSGQGLSQSWWLSTIPSLLYRQKKSSFSGLARVNVLTKHWFLIVQLNKTAFGVLWQIIAGSLPL